MKEYLGPDSDVFGREYPENAYCPIHASVMFLSNIDEDSCGSYYENYTPDLASWIEKGCPSSLNCTVKISSALDWNKTAGEVFAVYWEN